MKKLLGLILGFVGVIFVALPALADNTLTLLPTLDGTYSQWTPKSGSAHYTQVDEISCNGTTDYVSETTLGQRDSYGINISSVPNGAQITGIDITPCASKNSNGGANSTIKVFYRLNGVNSADSAGYSIGGTTPVGLLATSYSGLSTIKTGSTSLEIGSVYSAGSKGARLGRIAVVVTYNPLSAPTNLSAQATSSSQIDLSWTDNSTHEDGFKIERSQDGVSGWSEVGVNAANDTTFSNTSLSEGTTYYYRVYAYNTGGNSANSNTASTITYRLPSVTTTGVTLITQTSASLSAQVNPNSYSTDRFYKYDTANVGCSSLANTTGSVNIGSGTSVISPNSQGITSLSANTTYYFCAVAVSAAGTTYGNVLSFTTLPTVPSAPSSLAVVAASTSSANLSWIDNTTNEIGYRVERAFDPAGTWTQRGGDLATNSTAYSDTGLIQGATYYYRVYAFNSGGNSGYSNFSSVNTAIPLAPSLLTVTTQACGSLENIPVFLSWTDNSFNENFFEIERATDGGIPGATFEPVASVSANMTSYEDSFTDCGYRIRAVNAYAASPWAYTDLIN